MLATTRTTCADARHSPSLPLCVINTQKNGLQTMSLKKRMQTKKFLQMHFEFAYFSFFLIHLELRWQIRPYAPVVPSKTIPYCRNGWSVYPFSDQKGPKTILFRMAHIYMAYIREYRPPRFPHPRRGEIWRVSNLSRERIPLTAAYKPWAYTSL